MDFLPKELSKYAEEHTNEASELLTRIERETHLHVLKPRMISGHMQGRILSMLSKMIAPQSILEIGTYTGYSALCLAEGLNPNGELVTIDKNEELESKNRQYFHESPFNSNIKYLVGDALELITSLSQSWDLVFIDADKVNYSNYYDLIIPSVPSGGYIIADNVLWSGKIIDSSAVDEDTESLRLFNQKVQEDQQVENVLMPLRDGLMIVRKC